MDLFNHSDQDIPILIIIMGVSGCGKSTVAQQLSKLNVYEFMEADEFHSASAISKMSNGIPLDNDDRIPWIESMCLHLRKRASNRINCCLAYSGLKRAHRERFTQLGFKTIFMQLCASKEVILKQLENRNEHFMGSELLDSQFKDLETEADGEIIFKVEIQSSIEATVMSAQQLLLNQVFSNNY